MKFRANLKADCDAIAKFQGGEQKKHNDFYDPKRTSAQRFDGTGHSTISTHTPRGW
jgi:hypothetical protein